MLLSSLTSDMWTAEHMAIMKVFWRTNQNTLLIYIDEQNGLMACFSAPTFEVKEIAYFAREENAKITMDNFIDVVQFGTVHGSYVDGLLRTMHDLYSLMFLRTKAGPTVS